ncbi:PTS sugar transporter subunit IIA [Halalkalibacter oceani]|uniref:PTS sugar transporter subunit IIA n=1 Tax=Halalkalibacter oceani TaxID=1653776 RepID=A0A9X2DPQ8_9BACI|nr:PTS sugar transporter subunit IIA [Halalkalibacter oceani]MCM3714137.1 PTS sugar transporter subunit IIA [Halalkalibacter oceani]
MSEWVLNESTILIDLVGKTKEDILEVMGRNMVDHGLVKESYVDAVIKREGEYSTGLPTGGVAVAIPHTDVEHVRRKSISVAVLRHPVEFGVMGGAPTETVPVKVVFMLAMDEAHSQLKLLQQLMRILQSEEKLQKIVKEMNPTTLKTYLTDQLTCLSDEGGE